MSELHICHVVSLAIGSRPWWVAWLPRGGSRRAVSGVFWSASHQHSDDQVTRFQSWVSLVCSGAPRVVRKVQAGEVGALEAVACMLDQSLEVPSPGLSPSPTPRCISLSRCLMDASRVSVSRLLAGLRFRFGRVPLQLQAGRFGPLTPVPHRHRLASRVVLAMLLWFLVGPRLDL